MSDGAATLGAARPGDLEQLVALLGLLFEDLVVLPDRRGRGIGSALLRHVIDSARKEGLTRITLLTDRGNKRAQALYSKMGFVASTMTAMRLTLY